MYTSPHDIVERFAALNILLYYTVDIDVDNNVQSQIDNWKWRPKETHDKISKE